MYRLEEKADALRFAERVISVAHEGMCKNNSYDLYLLWRIYQMIDDRAEEEARRWSNESEGTFFGEKVDDLEMAKTAFVNLYKTQVVLTLLMTLKWESPGRCIPGRTIKERGGKRLCQRYRGRAVAARSLPSPVEAMVQEVQAQGAGGRAPPKGGARR